MRGNKVNDNLVKMLGTNNNILINSNFANPVNQRGNVSITNSAETGGDYWIDRWVFLKNVARTELRINDGYISITQAAGERSYAKLLQKVEFPDSYKGKRIAISFRYRATQGGAAYVSNEITNTTPKSIVTKLTCDGDWHIFKKVIELPNEGTYTRFAPICFFVGSCIEHDWGSGTIGNLSQDTTLDIEWAKVEVSDFCTPYVPRLYAEELQLCRRYFRYGSTNAQSIYDFPMRVTPTITSVATGKYSYDAEL